MRVLPVLHLCAMGFLFVGWARGGNQVSPLFICVYLQPEVRHFLFPYHMPRNS